MSDYDLQIYSCDQEKLNSLSKIYNFLTDENQVFIKDFNIVKTNENGNYFRIEIKNKDTNNGIYFGYYSSGRNLAETSLNMIGAIGDQKIALSQYSGSVATMGTDFTNTKIFYLKSKNNEIVFSPIYTNENFQTAAPFYHRLQIQDTESGKEIFGEMLLAPNQNISTSSSTILMSKEVKMPCVFCSDNYDIQEKICPLYDLLSYQTDVTGIQLRRLVIPNSTQVCKNLYVISGTAAPTSLGSVFSINGDIFVLVRNYYGRLALKVS